MALSILTLRCAALARSLPSKARAKPGEIPAKFDLCKLKIRAPADSQFPFWAGGLA